MKIQESTRKDSHLCPALSRFTVPGRDQKYIRQLRWSGWKVFMA